MKQYLDAVQQVLEQGTRKSSRTGVDTISKFNINYEIDLNEGFPLLTTKAISWKNIVVELLWFLSGDQKIDILKKHDCKFWDAWATEEGYVPSAYGYFWRHFPAVGMPVPAHPHLSAYREAMETDQIDFVVEALKKDPYTRRAVVSAWYPGNATVSKLPPCHTMFVLNTQNKPSGMQLCLHLTQRSCDMALGVPYNIASYSLLLHLISRFTGIPVGTFAHSMIDAHIYTAKADGSMAEYDHVPGLKQQLQRTPHPRPRLTIHPDIKSLDDINALLQMRTEEILHYINLAGYWHDKAIPFKVAV